MAYGAGCITKKCIRGTEYLYAEWYVNGRRKTKSCGNAAKPESHERAKKILKDAAQERIATLEDRYNVAIHDITVGKPTQKH